MIVVSGRSRGASMWKKGPAMPKHSSPTPSPILQQGIEVTEELMGTILWRILIIWIMVV